jgi:hypothetical protein
MQFLRTLLVVFSVTLIAVKNAKSCTIFIANDNKNVWIGNNEDDSPSKNYRLWFVPSKEKNENGYIIWAGILNGLAEKISHKFPEGGINEYGLFIDAAALPQKILIKKDVSKKDWKGYVIKDVLKNCKTVQEVLNFLSQYNLVEQEKAQIFVADASGDYAIIHANYVIKKETNNFALTNYCLNDGNQHLCWRRSIVQNMLEEKNEYDLNYIKKILEKSAQTDYFNKTNYSIAADLKQVKVHLFQKNDFTTSKVLTIKEELLKGERSEDITNLFPKNVSIELERTLTKSGLSASLEQYKQLSYTANNDYNFKNNDVVNFAIQLIGLGKVSEAKEYLKLTLEFQTDNSDAKLWLSTALKLEKDDKNSADLYTQLLQKQPENYLTNLFGNQHNSMVTFYLDHFEDAKTVYLAGDFTDWKAKAIEMKKEKGVWFCSLEIPKGEHQYKFIVEDVWVTDPKNPLIARENKNINSKLIVW